MGKPTWHFSLQRVPERQNCSYLAEKKLFCLTVSYWSNGTERVCHFDVDTEDNIGSAIDVVGKFCEEMIEQGKTLEDRYVRWDAYEITSAIMIRRGE